MLVVLQAMSRRVGAMLDSDVLYGFRLRLFELAAREGVSEACRVFGIHRSTYYRWKGMVERSGLEMLRPRESGGHRGCPTSSVRSSKRGCWHSRSRIRVSDPGASVPASPRSAGAVS